MPLSDPIQLRLQSQAKRDEYETLAAQQGVPLGEFLRQRLDSSDQVADALESIRGELTELRRSVNQGPVASAPDPHVLGALYEILLYARKSENPQTCGMIAAEVSRVGLPVLGGAK